MMDVTLTYDLVARSLLVALAALWVWAMVVHHRRFTDEQTLRELVVVLRADASGLVSALKHAGAAMARMGVAQRAAGDVLGVFGRQLALQADEAEAGMRLFAVAGVPHHFGPEVERRTELFQRWWQGMPMEPPRMTPRAAALRSVTDDVVAGRLA